MLLGRLAARGAPARVLVLGDSLAANFGARRLCDHLTQNDVLRTMKSANSAFCANCGKLMLITDPTRSRSSTIRWVAVRRKSDVAVMNMLSASFGLVFEDDFIYNMIHNSGPSEM